MNSVKLSAMRLRDNERVRSLLRTGLDRLAISLKALWESKAGQEYGKSYPALASYVAGKRVPQTKREREGLAKLFRLSPSERESLLDIEGARLRTHPEALSGVVAKDLEIYSFTDILSQYFDGADEPPSEAVVFSNGPALAIEFALIRDWLNRYLGKEGRKIIYVFPPPGVGPDHAAELEAKLGTVSTDWKSDLLSVVAEAIATGDGELIKDRQMFSSITGSNPLPQMFNAFGMGRTVFALRFEKRSVCYVTMPVHGKFIERLIDRTDPTHPPVLYVRLDPKAEQSIENDLRLLRTLVDKAESVGFAKLRKRRRRKERALTNREEPLHLWPIFVSDLLQEAPGSIKR